MNELFLLAETNFLIDVLLKQDRNAEHIMDLAEDGLVVLFLPEITFSEIYAALSKKHTKRLQHATESRQIANDLTRTPDHRVLAGDLRAIAQKLEKSCERDLATAQEGLEKVKQIVKLIEFTPEIHRQGFLIELDKRYGLSKIDAAIYASIVAAAKQIKSDCIFFLERDAHFDQPIIHDELASLGVKIIQASGECINEIYQYLEREDLRS